MTRSVPPRVGGMRHPAVPARRLDLVEVLHGRPVADPYRWLEDAGSAETRAVVGRPGPSSPASTSTPCPDDRAWRDGSPRCSRPARWAPRPGGPDVRSGRAAPPVRSTPCCSRATPTGVSASCSTRPRSTRPGRPPSTPGRRRRRAPAWRTSSRRAVTRSRCCTCSTSRPASGSTARSTAAATRRWPGCRAGTPSSTSAGSRPVTCRRGEESFHRRVWRHVVGSLRRTRTPSCGARAWTRRTTTAARCRRTAAGCS